MRTIESHQAARHCIRSKQETNNMLHVDAPMHQHPPPCTQHHLPTSIPKNRSRTTSVRIAPSCRTDSGRDWRRGLGKCSAKSNMANGEKTRARITSLSSRPFRMPSKACRSIWSNAHPSDWLFKAVHAASARSSPHTRTLKRKAPLITEPSLLYLLPYLCSASVLPDDLALLYNLKLYQQPAPPIRHTYDWAA